MANETDEEYELDLSTADYLSTTLSQGGAGALAGASVGGPWGAALGGLAGVGIGIVQAQSQAARLAAEQQRQDELDEAIAQIDYQADFAQAAGVKSRAERDFARSAIGVEERQLGLTGAQTGALRDRAEARIESAEQAGLAEALGTSSYMNEMAKMNLLEGEAVRQELVDATLSGDDAFGELAGLVTALGMSQADSDQPLFSRGGQTRGRRRQEPAPQDVAISLTDAAQLSTTVTPEEPVETDPLQIALQTAAETPMLQFEDATPRGRWSGVQYSVDPVTSSYTYTSPYTSQTKVVPQTSTHWGSIRDLHVQRYAEMYPGMTEEMLVNSNILLPRR